MVLLAIDGNSIINRAFYGIKLLSTKDGHFTNGIYGFLNILLSLRESYAPDGIAVAFDVKKPTFRHEMYAEYKAGRKGMPAELAEQMPVLKEILRAMGIRTLECTGFEADDILGTLSVGDFEKVYIATGRPPLIITNLGAIEHLIDGWITINGALCFVGDEIVSCKDIPHEAAQLVVDDAHAKDYGVIVVGERDVAVYDPQGEVDQVFRQEIAVENLDQVKPMDEVMQQRILQLTAFFSADYERELMARIPTCTSGRWHPAFTDITAFGADKGEGILDMARHLGFNPQYTIAFGDGGNDSSMIRRAGIGVAMGNALDSLKQEADYTTTSVDEDGIRNALRHFKLI